MSPHPTRAKLALVRPAPAAASVLAVESDSVLVAGVIAGDARCKKQLYLKHVGYIAGMCARLLRSVDVSEDVTQDTFVLAFTKIGSLRDPAAFRGWLAAIAVHLVHRRLARQRLLQFFGLDRSLDDAPLDDLAREDLSVEARSELAVLDFVLRQLPPRVRVAWMLRYVEDEPLASVAQACRCSLATTKRWIATADARIRQQVNLSPKEESS